MMKSMNSVNTLLIIIYLSILLMLRDMIVKEGVFLNAIVIFVLRIQIIKMGIFYLGRIYRDILRQLIHLIIIFVHAHLMD